MQSVFRHRIDQCLLQFLEPQVVWVDSLEVLQHLLRRLDVTQL